MTAFAHDLDDDVHVGNLPLLDGPPVPTSMFDFGHGQAAYGIRFGAIVTFDGAAGTGKTTTATVAANQSPLRFVYTKLRHGARTKETAEALFAALHPHEPLPEKYAERRLINDCTEALKAGNVGVIADEVHRIGVPGMLLLSNIWDTVKNETGRGFPLFLVGCRVHTAISSVEELDTRVLARVPFHPLSVDEVVPTVQAIDSRCAATPADRLAQVDKLFAHGNLRLWRNFILMVNADPAKASAAVTVDEVKAFLLRQGQTLKNAKIA